MPRRQAFKQRASSPELPAFKTIDYPVEELLTDSLPDFNMLDTYFPILEYFTRIPSNVTGHWLDSAERIKNIVGKSEKSPFRYLAEIETNSTIPTTTGYQDVFAKRAHILEPVRYMKGLYGLGRATDLPAQHSTYLSTIDKVNLPNNEAYVDAFGAYLASKLVETGRCPNFARFYGTLNGHVDEYAYNMTDEFHTFRRERWFPKTVGRLFTVYIEGKTPEETTAYLESLTYSEEGEYLTDDDLSESSSITSSKSSKSSTSSVAPEEQPATLHLRIQDLTNDLHSVDLTPTHTSFESDLAPMADFEFASDESDKILTLNPTSGVHKSFAQHEIYAVFKDFPVQLTFIEHLDGTMDSLLDSWSSDERVDLLSEGQADLDSIWLAYLFQIIFALAVLQKDYEMIQNDLHTNNVMYSHTSLQYLYYQVAGVTYRIPTGGFIMKIVDFGRATFKFRGQTVFSDAFDPDNDAGGQYNCPPYFDRRRQRIDPNPSFDLARLSSSMIEILFPTAPMAVLDASGEPRILAQERGRITYETVSPLFNLLTEWITDIDGKNVLRKPNGEERYPHFELYCVLAKKVRNGVPAEQFDRPAFEQFRFTGEVPEGETVYVL